MALQMKPNCEKCGTALPHEADAFICSHECTFCLECTKKMNSTCPNCEGELQPRPKRKQ